MNNIATAKIIIKASKEKVWDAITNPVQVKKYFFGTDMLADLRVDGKISFKGSWEGHEYEDKGIITEIKENEVLKYDYLSSMSGKEDIRENYIPIEYRLTETPNGVELTISQTCENEDGVAESEKNWGAVLEGMKGLVEGE